MEREFIEMINTHRGIIFKVCRMYDRENRYRDDLFQEIVLQLWRSFPGFRDEALPSTWMYRVALNTAITHFRKQKRKPEQQSLSAAELRISDPSAGQEDNGQAALLNRAIDQLTSIEKALIMLYLEEKNYNEISEIMGITTNHVGVKLNRIKTKLEQKINPRKNES
ncbi:MAG: RNA polymerase subunit sigma-70 [Azospira oryzae]|jgi:RNA polymerase sigma factor (sigma-70 family)|nr:MAG: RNA polymerase subunit sigma-70 [Azospira oryzae]